MQEKNSGLPKFLGGRLRQWRKSVPLKSYELAKLISISQGSLSDIENSKSLPSADTLSKIYFNTNLNVVWLLTGIGPMIREGAQDDELAGVYEEMEEYGKDPNLKELIEKLVRIYHQGDPEKKAHLLGFLIGADPGQGAI